MFGEGPKNIKARPVHNYIKAKGEEEFVEGTIGEEMKHTKCSLFKI